MRVAMYADFSPYSGYGQDGLDLALALTQMGMDVVPLPRTVTAGLPERFTRLLQKDPLSRRPDVVLAFVDPAGLVKKLIEPVGVPVVGYTMWEKNPILPSDFRKPEDYDLSWLDSLVVTCPMNVEAFAGCFPDREIAIAPAGIDPARWDGPRTLPHGRPMRFLMAGVLSERKNPFAVFEAWRALKQNEPGFDAELIVHSMGRNLHPRIAETYGPGIKISSKRLTPEQMESLYRRCDVLIAPSRGEGNNKPAMEFMASGGPVIASDWSGHQNFMHRDVGWLVDGRLVDTGNGSEWFDLDGLALYAAIYAAWAAPEEVVKKGRAAQRHIATFTWDRTAETIVRELEKARGRG